MSPEPRTESGTPTRSTLLRMLVVALVVVLVADLLARVVGGQLAEPLVWYDATTQVKDEQIERLGSGGIDDLAIGTSMTLRGFDAEVYQFETGRSTYNAALPGAVPSVTERWLLDQLVPRLHPERVILGVQTIDFSGVLDEDNLARWEKARATRPGFLGWLERTGSSLSGLVRHRQELRDPGAWLDWVRGDPGPVEDARPTLTELGLRDVYVDEFTEEARERTVNELATIELAPATDSLVRIAAALEGQGIELVLVEMPVSQAYIDLHIRGSTTYEEVRAHYHDLAAALDLELIDLATGWDADDHFTDYTHLDVEGAQRVARAVGAALKG